MGVSVSVVGVGVVGRAGVCKVLPLSPLLQGSTVRPCLYSTART